MWHMLMVVVVAHSGVSTTGPLDFCSVRSHYPRQLAKERALFVGLIAGMIWLSAVM